MRPIIQTFQKVAVLAKNKVSSTRNITLSDFFPKNTVYFYGYPSGEESGFLNLVPPTVEELVAARPVSCLGESMKVMCFSATTDEEIDPSILKSLNLTIPNEQIIKFPSNINLSLVGKQRNKAIRDFLVKNIAPGSLIMAQPFLDDETKHLFQINPDLSNWLNDKKNMSEYIDAELMPKKLGFFNDGKELEKKRDAIKVPCVIKVTSSSAGDGVYICRDKPSLNEALNKLSDVQGSILIEQLISEIKNYGIQFGIPHDKSKGIEIIGISEQITTKDGVFMGGLIEKDLKPKELEHLIYQVQYNILPKVRKMGWYGIGCFDILIDGNNNSYFIDANFRMTGMTVFLALKLKKYPTKRILSFTGEFNGTQIQLLKTINELVHEDQQRVLDIVAISNNDGTWRFNAALNYDNAGELIDKVNELLNIGIKSDVLTHIKDKESNK